MAYQETAPEDRAQLVELAREFNERVVAPRVAELDRQTAPQDSFSWEIIEEASKIGLRTLTLAPEYDGPGIDSLGAAMVIEELGKADTGISVVIAQTVKLIQTIQAACTQEQKDRYLPKIRDDDRYVLAIGLTEPDTSSNYIMPFDEPGGGYKTSAVERDGGWVINGMKHFVSNGSRAGLYLLFAQTVKGGSVVDGSTCFLIEDGTDGFTYGTVHDKLGERLANNSELIFQDCFVPAENVIGEPHRGYDVQTTFFPSSNAYAAATVLGTATGAYERALAWTQQRVQGGKPLIEHDTVAVTLAEMRMLLDVARTYVHHAAEASDHRDEGWDPMLSAYPKLFASQIAWQVSTKAMELHGGYGFMKNLGMEKVLRDTAAFLHSDGANLTLMLKAANVIRAEVA